MHITIDCRFTNASGIGVYLRECLRCFIETDHIFTLLGDKKQLAGITGERKNVRIIKCDIKPFSLRELAAFPKETIKLINSTDIYWSPNISIPRGIKIPIYTTIHDVIFFDMPGLVSKPGVLIRKFFFNRAAKKSAAIFTVSEFSKSRIKYHFGETLRVIVTYSAIKPSFACWQGPYPAKSKTILFVGNIKKHKGLLLLIEAFNNARNEGLDYTLRIAGSAGKLRSSDNVSMKLANEASVELFNGVDDEKLRALLCEASLLIQPSFYEGFGLPPLEAMTLGTAALISDIPVFKEIYDGFPVIFFKTGESTSLKDKMIELLYNKSAEEMKIPALQEELQNRYSFSKTAKIILEELCRTKQ